MTKTIAEKRAKLFGGPVEPDYDPATISDDHLADLATLDRIFSKQPTDPTNRHRNLFEKGYPTHE